MKGSKSATVMQRRFIEESLDPIKALVTRPRPRSGWLKAIRGSLGLTSRRLAARLHTDMAAVLRMEAREVKGTVTLESLDRVAREMGCRLVYAIVPESKFGSLEAILNERARALARDLAKDVSFRMKLESQGVDSPKTDAQVERLAHKLKEDLDSRLWVK